MTIQARAKTQTPTVLAQREGRMLLLRARELRGGLSLRAAASRIGIRADELGKIERGETRQVRWETLLGIAAAYDVEVSDLLVTRREPVAAPAYAGALAAIRSGQIAHGLPPRFVGDPDSALAEREAVEPQAAELVAFAEPVGERVGRAPFRPSAR